MNDKAILPPTAGELRSAGESMARYVLEKEARAREENAAIFGLHDDLISPSERREWWLLKGQAMILLTLAGLVEKGKA